MLRVTALSQKLRKRLATEVLVEKKKEAFFHQFFFRQFPEMSLKIDISEPMDEELDCFPGLISSNTLDGLAIMKKCYDQFQPEE